MGGKPQPSTGEFILSEAFFSGVEGPALMAFH
jgi:hypothetical protein